MSESPWNSRGSFHSARAHPSPRQRLLRLLKPERADITIIVVLSFLNGILLLATPLTVDAVVNGIAFGGQEGVYLQALVVLTILLLACLLLVALMRATQHYVMEIIQQRLFTRVTADLAYRLPHIQSAALERSMGPDLINRFFEIVTVQKSSSMLLLEGVNLVLATVIGLIVLAFYHPFLLAFALVLVAVLAVVIFLVGRNAVQTSIDESYAKHAVAGWLEQIAMFPIFFKSRGAADLACSRADQLVQQYLQRRRAHFLIVFRQICGLLGLQALASAALLVIGGMLVLRGELTLGQLVASELIVGAIVSSVSKFGKHMESWYDALASVDKLGYLVDLPIERENGEVPGTSTGPVEVRVEGVTFGFDSPRTVIQSLSIHLPRGSRVAVVGAAGCGVSTLLDMFFGLRVPQEGRILMDGLDLRDWQLKALRQQVALVRGQEVVEGTVLENVRLGRDDVSLEQVHQALEAVGLGATLQQMPDGLATVLKAGGRPLSSTQRTRLVLARAIVGRPRLLILDECLEGLEVAAMTDLEHLLFDGTQPWTLVLATRDPELIGRCDQIVRLGELRTVSSTPTTSTREPSSS